MPLITGKTDAVQSLPPETYVNAPGFVGDVVDTPAPGEPAFLADSLSKGPQDFEESHALVSNLPGLYGNGKILYLSGNTIASVMGAVQALTDPVLARQLVASLQTSSGVLPQFYQVVLKVKAMDDTPIDVSSVFHRELQLLKSASGAGSSR